MIYENDNEFITNRYYNIRWTFKDAKNTSINYNDLLLSNTKFPLNNENYDDITGLFCSDNMNNIYRLPKLPSKLQMLWCGGNNINDLGILPETLLLLSCYENPLVNINISEYATPNIRFYVASNTQIFEIYELPDSINKLFLASTNLKYISCRNFNHAKRIWQELPRKLDLRDTIILKEYNNSYTDFFQ